MTDMQLLEEISRTGDAFIKALYAAKDAGIGMDEPDTDIILRDTHILERPRHPEPNRFIRPCTNCGQTDSSLGVYRDEDGSIVWQLKCQSCRGGMAYGETILDCVHEWNGEHSHIKEK